MKRITLNALVDIGCLITFIPSLISGLVLYLVFPSGTGRGGEVVFLGIIRSQWVTMHNYTGLFFAALLIIHLLLHLKFFLTIKKNSQFRRRAVMQDTAMNALARPSPGEEDRRLSTIG